MTDKPQINEEMLKLELRILVLEKTIQGIVKEHPMIHFPDKSDFAGLKAEAHYEMQKKYPDQKIPSPFG